MVNSRLKTFLNPNKQKITMTEIRYSGTKLLTSIEKAQMETILEKELFKAERKTKDIERFSVHISKHNAEGKRAKININIKAEFPGTDSILAAQSDWDIKTASHKAVDNLKKELEKKFKKESSKVDLAFQHIKKLNRYLRKKFVPSKK